MKNLLLLSLLFTSTSVFASKLANIKTLTNANLEKANIQVSNLEFVTHVAAKKVLVLKANGKTAQEMREKTVAQSLHTLCPFFDDGVSLNLNAKNDQGSLQAATDLADSANVTEGDSDFVSLLSAIKIANAESTVEVYSGATSGNNTYGSVLGFYDVKNDELAVFASTNCGSDN